ncbi:spermidine/putrescine-binding protein [Bradyrhizobium sp. LM6.9]
MTNVGRSGARLGLAFAAALAWLPGPAGAEERVVNFYNWSNYVAPDVLDAFTRETGIKVVYDTFDANETLETRLMAGKSGYDVVVPTAYFLQRQIKANIFQKLDKSKLPNLANAWSVVTSNVSRSTIPAMSTPPTTCGARRASATMSRS